MIIKQNKQFVGKSAIFLAMKSAPYNLGVLVIMDGVGVAPESEYNAISKAHTPNLDRLWSLYPHTYLQAAGTHAGLPEGGISNSTIGHRNLGAGQILMSPKAQVDKSIRTETFYENPALSEAFLHAHQNQSAVHIIAALDDQETLSDIEHLNALLEMAIAQKADRDKLYIHLIGITEKELAGSIEQVNSMCLEKRMGRVVSAMGGMYALNNHQDWELTQTAYNALTRAEANVIFNYRQHLKKSYKRRQTDYTLDPFFMVINEQDLPKTIQEKDSVIFMSFQGEELTQLVRSLNDPILSSFPRLSHPSNLSVVTLSEYGQDVPAKTAFSTVKVEKHLGRVISNSRIKQVRIAESDKFADVTYFFNQGETKPMPGELQLEVPLSDGEDPALNQRLITDVLVQKLEEGYGFGVINLSGPDTFGHEGDPNKVSASMEVVDECLGRIANTVTKLGGCLFITADHGNAEKMYDEIQNAVHTGHTDNSVPCIIVGNNLIPEQLKEGTLADVAPTLLKLLDIEVPAEMTGTNLFDV